MRTLILDNHDSFTFNLFHLLGEVNGEAPLVLANDACAWAEIEDLSFDNILISPGPGTPLRPADLGLSAEAVRHAQVPLLGVCLGHQALAALAGGGVRHAPEPMHGRLSRVRHAGSGLFAGLPDPLPVVRYHSLIVAEPLPPGLRVTARGEDGLVMALEDEARPRWGVQFHPESICSTGGRRLIENFRDLTRDWQDRTSVQSRAFRQDRPGTRHPLPGPLPEGEGEPKKPLSPGLGLAWPARPTPSRERGWGEGISPLPPLRFRELPSPPDAEAAFLACFAEAPEAFWLDSALLVPGLSRWSFLGTGRRGPQTLAALQRDLRAAGPSVEAPFPFRGGWVGWIGYEAKGDCGYARPHPAPTPDLALLFAERFLVLDHAEGRAWLAAVLPEAEAEAWFDRAEARLDALPPAPPPPRGREAALAAVPRHGAAAYLQRIAAAQREIRDGESYEICLTNRLELAAEAEPLTVYRHLRRLNPAPWAAFLRIGGVAVAGSSPERFLAVSAEGGLEAKPIKGTARRGRDAAEDAALAAALAGGEKDRAENLMIVDLLRHDLGRVAALGSVSVPALMAVESYATLHQLVSTVRARLAPEFDAVDALRAAFPPGSMTGAPKRRTIEILDRLEEGPRGVYSGALGWIGRDGAADLSVVIRTLVQEAPGRWSLGAGGAITALSDPRAELEELRLKARAPLAALALAATGDSDGWYLADTEGEGEAAE